MIEFYFSKVRRTNPNIILRNKGHDYLHGRKTFNHNAGYFFKLVHGHILTFDGVGWQGFRVAKFE
jgi:hypothetical protein